MYIPLSQTVLICALVEHVAVKELINTYSVENSVPLLSRPQSTYPAMQISYFGK